MTVMHFWASYIFDPNVESVSQQRGVGKRDVASVKNLIFSNSKKKQYV